MRSNISGFRNSPKNPYPETYQIYYLLAFSVVGRPLIPFLRKLGLNCTEPKKNPAQGTVSTLIFFENVYLEILWFESTSHLAQSDMMAEFNFLARVNWLETGASPFAFGLSYPTNHGNFLASTVKEIGYNSDDSSISEQLVQFCPINLSNPEEPICYLVPNYDAKRNRLNRVLATDQQIMNPSLEMRKLTHVKLRVISDQLSLLVLRDSFLAVNLYAQNLLEIEYKKHPLLELTFDDGNQKRFVDLRPFIPIVLRY